MTTFCIFHKKEPDQYEWRSCGSGGWICRDGLQEAEAAIPTPSVSFNIGVSKKDARIAHWRDIQSRVTTHDGQFLKGKSGRDYQKKYSKKMLGKDLSQPTNYNTPSFQKELTKTI